MSSCFLTAALYWDLWSGCFRAADSYHIAGVIPCNFQYDYLFQSKLFSVDEVSGLYIYTKFYQGTSTMSDPVVDCSHVRGWSFPCSLSRCYEPILYHHKHISTANKALNVHFLLYFSYAMRYYFLIAPLYWDLWGGQFRSADSYHIAGVIPSYFQYDYLFQSKIFSVHEVSGLYISIMIM